MICNKYSRVNHLTLSRLHKLLKKKKKEKPNTFIEKWTKDTSR